LIDNAKVLAMRTILLTVGAVIAFSSAVPANDFPTRAEATGYRQTADYAETIEYLLALERESRWVRLEEFGTTPLGRPMYAVVVSSERAFSPEAVKYNGKLIVMIQNGIHAGEIDGKDASLALIRDVAVTRTRADLLDSVTLVVLPVYNIDGHEMSSPYNRINQNGPEEMGFRATSQNYNLNRDYVKADAPETRAFIALWNRWLPDLFIDNHITDGADFQYAVTYTITQYPNAAGSIRDWARNIFIPVVSEKMAAMKEPIIPYVITMGGTVDKGIVAWAETPRFSTGYAAVRNRPGLLIEMHMLKDYRRRVTANYKMMVAVLEMLNAQPDALRRAVAYADSDAVAGVPSTLPLSFQRDSVPDTIDFLGYAWDTVHSEISGSDWIRYDTTRPVTLRIPYYRRLNVRTAADVPYAYIIPRQWTDVIERLALHDVEISRLKEPVTLDVRVDHLDSVSWESESYEGHHAANYKTTTATERITYPAGTAVILTAQPDRRLIVNALEPEAPDAFLRWGFFDLIMEAKKYSEDYALEKLAREMLAADPQLKSDFEAKLAADSAFAASPRARWDFFYKRSPYAEPELNVYPVTRLMTAQELPLK